MIDRELLKCYGFTDEVWMNKTYLDANGYHFKLSINAESGWSCLEQINEQGLNLKEVAAMKDILNENTKMILRDNQIALLPFDCLDDVKMFWKLLTKQDL